MPLDVQRSLRAALLALAAAPVLAGPVSAQVVVPDGFSHEVVSAGLLAPVGIAVLPDGRLLVVEQKTAKIRLIRDGALLPDVGTVADVNASGLERGLLGIAVDPLWPSQPYVYVHFTGFAPDGVHIERYRLAGDLTGTGDGQLTFAADARYRLLDAIPDVRPIHNGGTVRFGPDGKLYVSLGEDDDRCAAQDTVSLRGVIGGGPPAFDALAPADNPYAGAGDPRRRLIWALGLRNPFRFHIDPANGALFIADVGYAKWEEVDRADHGGLNFGWPGLEALEPFQGGCPAPSPTPPIQHYGRGSVAAIVSAGVYRAPAGASTPFPLEYEGDFFVNDFYEGRLRRLSGSGDTWAPADTVAGQPSSDIWALGLGGACDFAVGPDGSLWFCRQDGAGGPGTIERIRAVPGARTPIGVGVTFGAPTPTPASESVQFDYVLTGAAIVDLSIFDLGGRLVRRLVERRGVPATPQTIPWNGLDDDGHRVRPGVYVARLEVNGTGYARRVVFVR